jgi:hypothetical protein
MPSLDEKMSQVAELVLKRSLTEDEQLEMYKISDALGMNNVQSFLHQLLVFKLYEDVLRKQFEQLFTVEDRLNERLDGIATLETQINTTLEMSVERILGEGAARIGRDMGDEIASNAKSILSTVGDYYRFRAAVLLASFVSTLCVFSYCLGSGSVLDAIPKGGILHALLFMPAGWCFFLCGVTYTFFWVGDNWVAIKRKKRYKAIWGGQVIVWLILAIKMI